MPIFTINAGPGVEEILQMALHVNSAVFIYEKAGRETLVIVPDSRKRVVRCRDLHQAMEKAKIEEELASRPAVFAISIQTLSRDLAHLELFAKAINMRVIAIDAPVEAIGVYFVKHKPFDGKVIWVQPGETQRLRDLIS